MVVLQAEAEDADVDVEAGARDVADRLDISVPKGV